MRKTVLYSILSLLVFIHPVSAQVLNPVKWKFEYIKNQPAKATLIFTAEIENNWHLYSTRVPEGGPIATTFHFDKSDSYSLSGEIIEISKAEEKYDESFGMKIGMFSHKAVFKQLINLPIEKKIIVTGYIEFMSCDDSRCLPPKEVSFKITIPAVEKKQTSTADDLIKADSGNVITSENTVDTTKDSQKSPEIINDTTKEKPADKSLWGFFLLAFLAGFAGFLTPCVFPMVPMTVSFFMNSSKSRLRAVLNSLFFGFSIMAIYTSIGAILSLTSAGSGFANALNSHWIPNIIFFLLFFIFGLSFLGMFEIVMPGWLVNKTDKQAEKGGITGAFFMALTTVIVSFSCTGPIVGSLLVEAASGAVLKPTVGMFGFGLAFSLPFTVLALFPSLLKNLPKSGSWMNAIKVTLAVIMISFGFKFLVVIDQTYHLTLLSREIVLASWIILYTFLGFYLLGKIKLPHDSDMPFIKIPRLIFALISFTFSLYLFTGFLGNPLKPVSVFLPPASSSNIIYTNEKASEQTSVSLCSNPKYSDKLKLSNGLKGYFTYEEGLACAKQLNKPVLLYFKGHACTNCKKMDEQVWSNEEVRKRLNDHFIIIALYVDDRTPLPEEEWVTSGIDGRILKTLGKKNADFQISRFQINSQPYYVILDTNGNNLGNPIGYEPDITKYIRFLDTGIK